MYMETSIQFGEYGINMEQILANKILITTFSLVSVKYSIDHTAAMGIFAWAMNWL